jgi:O-antigen/teichoic acid export membrane protein
MLPVVYSADRRSPQWLLRIGMPRIPGPLLARLVDNALWQALGEVASRSIGLVVTIFLARLLGVQGFGIFGTAFALVGYISIVVTAGVDVHGIRSLAQEPRKSAETVGRVLAARLMLASGGAAALALIVAIAPLPPAYLAVVLVAAMGLFTLALNLAWALRALERGRTLAVGVVLQQLTMLLLVMLTWRMGQLNALSAAATQIAAEAVLVAWNYRGVMAQIGRIDWPARSSETLKLIRASSVLLAGRVPRLLFYSGDVLLVAWLVSTYASGEYLAGQRLVLTFVTGGVLVLGAVFPHSCRLAALDRGRFLEFQATVLRLLMLALIPISVLGAFFASPLIVFVYGGAYVDAAPVMSVLFVILPIFVGSLVVQDTLVALHRNRILAVINLAAMVIHLSLALALASKLAGLGVVIACLVGETAGLLALVATFWRDPAWSGAAREAAARCMLPLAAGAAMYTVLWLAAPVGAAFSVALVAGAYLAIGYWLRAFSSGEVVAMFGAMRRMAARPGRSA